MNDLSLLSVERVQFIKGGKHEILEAVAVGIGKFIFGILGSRKKGMPVLSRLSSFSFF